VLLRFWTIFWMMLVGAGAAVAQAPGDELLRKTAEYREALGVLLPLCEDQAAAAGKEVARLTALYRERLVARVRLESAQRSLEDAEARLTDTRSRLAECDSLALEVRLAIEQESGSHEGDAATRDAVIFFAGKVRWSSDSIGDLSRFYTTKFGAPLPVSAIGQTALHTRMGFVHKDAVDVALHPDSVEGQDLMTYLRQAEIPFIAFRQAVAGSATGAHIHVGPPSLRVYPPGAHVSAVGGSAH
jgi:hypothetical protein